MKRKTLISVVLLIIMLLSCIVPSLGVYATESSTNSITLNSELYTAVSDYLKSNYTGFSYNDLLRRITLNGSNFSDVEKLDLSGCEIKDLTGLEVFSGLKHLELSGNNLTEESNLEVINSFSNLEVLDLSTNKIGDFSALSLDKYSEIQLHSQAVKKVEIVSLPEYTDEAKTSMSQDFTGFLSNLDSSVVDFKKNMITNNSIDSMNNNTKIKVNTVNSKLKGVTLFDIYGTDNTIERRMYNLNITVNSGLYDESVVDLYYITILDDEEGIVFKDEKFYNIVKEQLTTGQSVNSHLDTYRSSTAGNIYEAAYDKALTLVIKDDSIINRIPALIAENNMIEDLTGLEYFVGLESNLNLSNNYIDSIEKVKELAQNKIAKEEELRAKVKADLEKIKTLKDKIKEYDEKIEKECSKLNEENHDTATCEECKKIADEKSKAQSSKEKTMSFLENAVDQLYSHYKNIYKATLIVPVEVEELTNDEISQLSNEDAEKYFDSTIDKLCKMYDFGAFGKTVAADAPSSEYGDAEGLLGYYFVEVRNVIEDKTNISEEGFTSADVKDYLNDYKTLEEDGRFNKYKKVLKKLKDYTNTVILETDYDVENSKPNTSCTYMYLANAYAYLTQDSAAVDKYVVLPRLKNLNMSANDIETLEGLEILKELEVLNMEDNLILTVDNVNWADLVGLTTLNLNRNQLTNIQALSKIKNIESLLVAYNLLSGKMDFEFGNYYEKLSEIDFSGNYYDDVQIILDMYSADARQENKTIGEYLEQLGLDVKLYNQIIYKNYGEMQNTGSITVQLPKIFKQIEEIAPKETSFGVAPGKGDVYKKGAEAVFQDVVEDKATVQITSVNDYDLSIGDSTTCYITFNSISDDNTNIEDTDTPTTPPVEDDNKEEVPEGTEKLTAEDVVIYDDGDANKFIFVYKPDATVASLADVILKDSVYGINRVNGSTDFKNDKSRLYTSESVSLVTGTGDESNVDAFEVVVVGDVDGDGDIDSIDSGYARALRYDSLYKDIEDKAERIELMNAFKATSNFRAADMNTDETVDKVETRAILYYRAGLINNFKEFVPKG